MGHGFAISVRDALGLIDRDAYKALIPAAFHFHLDQFEPFGIRHALRDLPDFGRHLSRHSANPQQKSGLSPTRRVRHSNHIVACLRGEGKCGAAGWRGICRIYRRPGARTVSCAMVSAAYARGAATEPVLDCYPPLADNKNEWS